MLRGIDPWAARAGRDSWLFHTGSAAVRIFQNRDRALIATSPLALLPQANLRPLLEHILAFDAPPYYLSIADNEVYLSYRLHETDVLDGRRTALLQQQLAGFLATADELDDELITRYGCAPGRESTLRSAKAGV